MGAFLLFLAILCFISGTVSVAIAISLTGEVKDMSFAEQIFKIFVPLSDSWFVYQRCNKSFIFTETNILLRR